VDVDVDVDVDGAVDVVEMKEEEICTQYKLCDHLLAVLAVSALLALLRIESSLCWRRCGMYCTCSVLYSFLASLHSTALVWCAGLV